MSEAGTYIPVHMWLVRLVSLQLHFTHSKAKSNCTVQVMFAEELHVSEKNLICSVSIHEPNQALPILWANNKIFTALRSIGTPIHIATVNTGILNLNRVDRIVRLWSEHLLSDILDDSAAAVDIALKITIPDRSVWSSPMELETKAQTEDISSQIASKSNNTGPFL